MEPNLNESAFQAPVWLTRVDIEIQTKKSVFFELKADNFSFSSQPIAKKDSYGTNQQKRSWKNLSLQIPANTASKIDIFILVHKKKRSKHSKILGQGSILKNTLIYNHSLLSDDHAQRESQAVPIAIQNGSVSILVRLYPLVTSPVAWTELYKLDQMKAFSELERLCVEKIEGQLLLYLTSSVVQYLQERLAKWAYQAKVERNGKTKSARLAAKLANEVEDTIFRIWTYLVSSSKLNLVLIRNHSGPAIAAHLKLSVPRLSSLLELLKSLMNANSSDMRIIIGSVLNLLQLAVNKALKKRKNGKYVTVAGSCFHLIKYLDLKYLKPLMKTSLPSIIVQIISDASSPQLLDNAFDTIKFFGTDLKAEIASSHLFDALKTLSEANTAPHLRLKSVYLLSKFSMLPMESTSTLIQSLSIPILEEPDLATRLRNITHLSNLLVSFDDQTLHSTLQNPELLDSLLHTLVLQSTNQKLISSLILARISSPIWIKANFPHHFKTALENTTLDWMSLCFLLNLLLKLSHDSFSSTSSETLHALCSEVFASPSPPAFIPPLPTIPSSEPTPVSESHPIARNTDSICALPDTVSGNTESAALPASPPSFDDSQRSSLVNNLAVDHSELEASCSPHYAPHMAFALRLNFKLEDSLKIITTLEELGIWSYLVSSVSGEGKIAVFIFLCRLPTPILIYLALKHELLDIIGRSLSDIDEIDHQIGYTMRYAFLGALVRLSALPLPPSLNLDKMLAKIASSTVGRVAIYTDWQLVTTILDLLWPYPKAFRSAVSVLVKPSTNGVVEYLLPWICESMERCIRSGQSSAEVLYSATNLAQKMILPYLDELFTNSQGFSMTPEMKSRRLLLRSYGLFPGNPTTEEQFDSYSGAQGDLNYTNLGFHMPHRLEKSELASLELDDSASGTHSHGRWSDSMDFTDLSSELSGDDNDTETDFTDSLSDITSTSSSTDTSEIGTDTESSSVGSDKSSGGESNSSSSSSGSKSSSSSNGIDEISGLERSNEDNSNISDTPTDTEFSDDSMSDTESTSDSDTSGSDPYWSSLSSSDASWSRSDSTESFSVFDNSDSFYESDDSAYAPDYGGTQWRPQPWALPIENALFNRFAILFPRSLTIMSLKHFNKLSVHIQAIAGRVSSSTASTILRRDRPFPSWVERTDRDSIYYAYCSEILFDKTVDLLNAEARLICQTLWKLLIEYSVPLDVPLMHNLKYLQTVRSITETLNGDGILSQPFCPLSIPDDGMSLSARWSSIPIVGPPMKGSPPKSTELSDLSPPLIASLDSSDMVFRTGLQVPFYPLPQSERDVAYRDLRREALSPSKPPAFLTTLNSVTSLFCWAENLLSIEYPSDSLDSLRAYDSHMLFLWSTLFWIAKSITDSKVLDTVAHSISSLIDTARIGRWSTSFDMLSTICLLLVATSHSLGKRLKSIKGYFDADWYPFTPAILDFWASYEKFTDNSVRDIYAEYSDIFGKKASSFNREKDQCITISERSALKRTSLSHISLLCNTVSCSLWQNLASRNYGLSDPGFIGGRAIVASEQILTQILEVTQNDPTIADIMKSPMLAILELSARGDGSHLSTEMVTPFVIHPPPWDRDWAEPHWQPPEYSTDATGTGLNYVLVLLEHLIALARLISKCAILYPKLLDVYFDSELLTIPQILGDPSLPMFWVLYPLLLLEWPKRTHGPLLRNIRDISFRSHASLIARHLNLLLSSEWTQHYVLIALIAGLGGSPDATEAELSIASYAVGQPESALSRYALAAFITRNSSVGIQLLPGPQMHHFWAHKHETFPEALPSWEIISLLPASMLSELLISSSDISTRLVSLLPRSISSNDILRKVTSFSNNAETDLRSSFPACSALVELFEVKHSFSDPRTFYCYATSMSESLLQVSNDPLKFIISCPSLVVYWLRHNSTNVNLPQMIAKTNWKHSHGLEAATRMLLIVASLSSELQLKGGMLHDVIESLWSPIAQQLKNLPGQWYFELGAALSMMETFKTEHPTKWAFFALSWKRASSRPPLPTPSSRYTSPLEYHMAIALGVSQISEENLLELPTYLSTACPLQDKPPSELKKFPKIHDAASLLLRPPSYTISTTDPWYRFISYDHGYVLPPCTDPVHVVLSNPICNTYEELFYGPNPPERIKFEMVHLRMDEEPEIIACIGLATAGALEQIKSDHHLRVGDVEGSWCVDISPLGLCSRSNGNLCPIWPAYKKPAKRVRITGLPPKRTTTCNMWSLEIDLAQSHLRVRVGRQKLVVHDIDFSSPLFIVISYQSPAVATLGRCSGTDLNWSELSSAYPFEALPLNPNPSQGVSPRDPTSSQDLKHSKKRRKPQK